MRAHHWMLVVVVLVLGYVLGVLWQTPAQLVGLTAPAAS